MNRIFLLFCLLAFFSMSTQAQFGEELQINGNFQMDAYTYSEDSLRGAESSDEKILMMSYANINASYKNFTAGIRYEGYMNSLQGYNPVNEGVGIPHYFATYRVDEIEVTVGSYYEQFGSGLVFRTYEEKTIGYDNAMNGIRVKYNIGDGIILKGIYGRQRERQAIINNGTILLLGDGIVRGLDAEFSMNEIFGGMVESKTRLTFGGSFVSKYQEDDDPTFKLPLNTAAGAARFGLSRGKIRLEGEYAYKSMDPSAGGTDNSNGNVGMSYIYRSGQAAFLTASYSQKGMGISLSAKSIDNMNFRSERTAKLNDLSINYIPDINKNHTYAFAAMFPYGTQPSGEAGFRAEFLYKFKKNTPLGGKYGTHITLNYSRMFSLTKELTDTIEVLASNEGTVGYKTSLVSFGDELFHDDLFLAISKKFSKKVKGDFLLQKLSYNNSIIHGAAPAGDGSDAEEIHTFTGVANVTYKFQSKKALRTELQYLHSEDQNRDWMFVSLEYSIPNWFFTITNQYNLGNPNPEKVLSFPSLSVAYNHKATRIQLGYASNRQGVICAGGVCRVVPASNGFVLSITSSF